MNYCQGYPVIEEHSTLDTCNPRWISPATCALAGRFVLTFCRNDQVTRMGILCYILINHAGITHLQGPSCNDSLARRAVSI